MNIDDAADQAELVLAGRPVPRTWDRVRRYCGLEWSGGPPEVWAYGYYDTISTDPGAVDPLDVLSTAALHPGLSRADLAFFAEQRLEIEAWIAPLPLGLGLADADDATLEHLERLAVWPAAPTLALLSKVLHRKRPELIPLVDRHVVDWYRPVTGERSAPRAWPLLLRAMRHDLADNAQAFDTLGTATVSRLDQRMSDLRIADIALWMGSR
ncbi:MAG: hypothetical protein JJE52_01530 [Acidimicrobiia bacterium]|nr:hypothetical protein [Acidimicrobiia bacterium]